MTRSERARMGGDWVVCCLLLTRKIRDVVRWNFTPTHKCYKMLHRQELGKKLAVICLDMEPEDQMER